MSDAMMMNEVQEILRELFGSLEKQVSSEKCFAGMLITGPKDKRFKIEIS
jgi:hypothetical protein